MHKQELHNASYYLQSFRSGEEKGFAFFFKEYYAALSYFSFQIIKDKEAADEIAGDALMKLWERRGNFNSIASIRSFLYIVARNESLNWLRQQKKNDERVKEFAYLTTEDEETRMHQIIEAEFYREIFLALETLPPKCREIFRMFFIQGKDHNEIAQELNLSIKTVYNQKARALLLLKERIAFGLLAIVFLQAFL